MSKSTMTAIVVVVLISPFAACQSLFVLRGDYLPRLVLQSDSPDKALRLEVTTRARFPAFDILSPDGKAYFRVVTVQTGNEVARAEVFMWEVDDFPVPEVVWSPSQVVVSGFDDSDPAESVTLVLRR